MRIAVAGGTGTVGRHIVSALSRSGHDAVVLSRSAGVDLMSANGLAAVLDGCTAVIDASSCDSLARDESVRFFGTVTENLLAAERAASVPHHVALSIVGAAGVDAGYYAGKRVQEERVQASGSGWTLLRTTQFHEFAVQMAARPRVLGAYLVPRMRSQPVAAATVAAELVAIASGAPRGVEPDLAGPSEERMADLVRRYLRRSGGHGPVLEVPLPGGMGRAMRDGSLLLGAGGVVSGPTFAEWLGTIGDPD